MRPQRQMRTMNERPSGRRTIRREAWGRSGCLARLLTASAAILAIPRTSRNLVRRRSRSSWERVSQRARLAWLWPDWLAHGKLHIFAGRPGCLKTTTAIGFAAGVTVGGYWPDGTRMAQGNVVVWSGEDAIDDTLLPRFIAAGGDREHIAFIAGVEEDGKSRAFDPARDMEALADVCAELGSVNLIIIDPVVMIAKGDSHKNAETRKDLQPLVDLAERTQAVVIGIHHLTKRSEGANPVDRVSGSLAFGAAPRVILLNALDPKGGAEPRGVLMRAKSNIGPSHGGYSFSAEQRPLDDEPDISAQRILWGGYVDKSASDILEEFEGKAKVAAEKKRKIVEFLSGAMADRAAHGGRGRGRGREARFLGVGHASGVQEDGRPIAEAELQIGVGLGVAGASGVTKNAFCSDRKMDSSSSWKDPNNG